MLGKTENFFILNLATPNKTIQVIKRKQSIHSISNNKKIKVWY